MIKPLNSQCTVSVVEVNSMNYYRVILFVNDSSLFKPIINNQWDINCMKDEDKIPSVDKTLNGPNRDDIDDNEPNI